MKEFISDDHVPPYAILSQMLYKIDEKNCVVITLQRLRSGDDGVLDMGYLSIGASLGVAGSTASSDDDLKWANYLPVHGRPFYEPLERHVMKTPQDCWELELDGWPRIYARVERIQLESDPSKAVDVLDLFIFPDGDAAKEAKISVDTAR